MSWEKELQLKQVDEMIAKFKNHKDFIKPKRGWINLIRKALDMSACALGKRVGLAQSRISLIEKGEINDSITLSTLRKVADGLECELVYFLVPKDDSLSKLREKQAYKNARSIDSYAEKHMSLEAQNTSKQYQEENIEKLKQSYLQSWARNFWNKK